jgi:5-methylcytosine-specific restriction protein A
MTFVRTYLDQNGETDRIWGRHWRYVIEGEALRALRRPFNIAELQVSAKNYGRGGPIVHVDPLDEEILRRDGYFDALRDG